MKTLRFIGMAIIAVIMSVNFAACSDDDEEDNKPNSEKIVGQWILTYEEGYITDPTYPEDNQEWSHAPKDEIEYLGNLTFRADGTFVESDLDNSELWSGKWKLSNNLLTLTGGDEVEDTSELKVLEVSANKLVLEYYLRDTEDRVEYSKTTYKKK